MVPKVLKDMMTAMDADSSGAVTLQEWIQGGMNNVPLLVLLGLKARSTNIQTPAPLVNSISIHDSAHDNRLLMSRTFAMSCMVQLLFAMSCMVLYISIKRYSIPFR